jgi:transposase
LAYQYATYKRLDLVRRKWKRIESPVAAVRSDTDKPCPRDVARILVAELPESVWPDFMADPSVIAAHIIAKYDDCLPLHRQERISARNGFSVPRSTQCGWLSAAHENLERIVTAMFTDARANAFCIALDSTGVPVLAPGGCRSWPMFVFIADRDHVVFQYATENTSEVVSKMLAGYRGHILADAAPVFDILYRDGDMTEVACWFHYPEFAVIRRRDPDP